MGNTSKGNFDILPQRVKQYGPAPVGMDERSSIKQETQLTLTSYDEIIASGQEPDMERLDSVPQTCGYKDFQELLKQNCK